MKRLPPDNRLDWRDPDMPVYRNYRMRDGSIQVYVEPDYEHRYREFMMQDAAQKSWRNDPTYNLRRKP